MWFRLTHLVEGIHSTYLGLTILTFLPLRPLTISRGFRSRHNFDGIVTYSYIDEKIPPPSYLQLFRSGIIESVDTRRIRTYDNEQLMIPGTSWEDELLGAVRQHFEIQANIGVTPPLCVMLGLFKCEGGKDVWWV